MNGCKVVERWRGSGEENESRESDLFTAERSTERSCLLNARAERRTIPLCTLEQVRAQWEKSAQKANGTDSRVESGRKKRGLAFLGAPKCGKKPKLVSPITVKPD